MDEDEYQGLLDLINNRMALSNMKSALNDPQGKKSNVRLGQVQGYDATTNSVIVAFPEGITMRCTSTTSGLIRAKDTVSVAIADDNITAYVMGKSAGN